MKTRFYRCIVDALQPVFGNTYFTFFSRFKKNTTFMFFEMTHQKVVKVLEFEKLQDVIGA